MSGKFVRTLDKAVETSDQVEGFMVDNLSQGMVLEIETQTGSKYRVVIIDPAQKRVKISGGGTQRLLSRDESEAIVVGSTWGGSVTKVGFIGVGMFLELSLDDGRIMRTTPIQSISIVTFTPVSDKVH